LLAQLYGEGITALALDLGIGIQEAKDLKADVFRPIPKVQRMIWNFRNIAERYKLTFSISGRIMPIPTGVWGVDTHKGINYAMQGSAYDTLAEAIYEIDRRGLSEAIYLAMHDELVVSTEAAEDIKAIMEQPPDRLIELSQRTPVLRTDRADLGDRWAEA
jgi:DNA polymerase-1